MAGYFELFTDHQTHLRFQFLSPDGSVLALSGPLDDKRAAAAAITEVRHCAGTGLIKDHSQKTTNMVVPKPGLALELEDLMLNNKKIEDFVEDLTALAAKTVTCGGPGTACCITISRPKRQPIKAWSTPLARSLDQLEDNLTKGPNLAAMALRIADLTETLQDLYAALEHRTVIDTALGVVMGQNHCDQDTAFNILRRAASSRNMKLRDLGASVVQMEKPRAPQGGTT